ncbi:MAG: hypothetical protein AVDCRST_MAG02-4716, partial [uncultured Rubrobacteraceae bacterium]
VPGLHRNRRPEGGHDLAAPQPPGAPPDPHAKKRSPLLRPQDERRLQRPEQALRQDQKRRAVAPAGKADPDATPQKPLPQRAALEPPVLHAALRRPLVRRGLRAEKEEGLRGDHARLLRPQKGEGRPRPRPHAPGEAHLLYAQPHRARVVPDGDELRQGGEGVGRHRLGGGPAAQDRARQLLQALQLHEDARELGRVLPRRPDLRGLSRRRELLPGGAFGQALRLSRGGPALRRAADGEEDPHQERGDDADERRRPPGEELPRGDLAPGRTLRGLRLLLAPLRRAPDRRPPGREDHRLPALRVAPVGGVVGCQAGPERAAPLRAGGGL